MGCLGVLLTHNKLRALAEEIILGAQLAAGEFYKRLGYAEEGAVFDDAANSDVLGASGMRVASPTLQFNVSLSRCPSEIRTQDTSSSHAQAADPLHR